MQRATHCGTHLPLTFVQSLMRFVLLPQRGIVSITYQRSDIEFVRSSKVKLPAKEKKTEKEREQRKSVDWEKCCNFVSKPNSFVLCAVPSILFRYRITAPAYTFHILPSFFFFFAFYAWNFEVFTPFTDWARVKRILCEIYGIPLLETIWCDTSYDVLSVVWCVDRTSSDIDLWVALTCRDMGIGNVATVWIFLC